MKETKWHPIRNKTICSISTSELRHRQVGWALRITALFVTATSATPLSPKMVPHRKIHWITPQNPRFDRPFG
ncbi:MAG: hypothetical protein WBD59_00775, partial [Candidatus Sulfotelmatobacter sp.]